MLPASYLIRNSSLQTPYARLNFIAELYSSQTNLPFYLVTSNPQLIRGSLDHWKIKRVGHGSHGREDTRINRELVNSNSRRRLGVSMIYNPI
jgi:hypothetical protein